MACRKPALEQSTTRPCRSSRGANAIECSRKSSRPQRSSDLVEHRLQLPVLAQVEWRQDLRLQLAGERLDMRLGLLAQIGHGEIGTEEAERLGTAPGDRLVVGDPGDQALAAGERHRIAVEHASPHAAVTALRAILEPQFDAMAMPCRHLAVRGLMPQLLLLLLSLLALPAQAAGIDGLAVRAQQADGRGRGDRHPHRHGGAAAADRQCALARGRVRRACACW